MKDTMHRFASGNKKSYYGKGDVTVYRLNRDGANPPVFGANVLILIYGDAFWPTYTTGDNSNLVATDSMKNFIQRETLNFAGDDLESYCRFIAAKFLATYPQAEGAQVSASRIPYDGLSGEASPVSFAPGGPDCAHALIELTRAGAEITTAEIRSGIRGFRLLRLNGSAFKGFVRDQYTTLPDIANRPLHMWLDLDWTYVNSDAAFTSGVITAKVRQLIFDVFNSFESGSIQQIIYQIGARMLQDIDSIAEINLEAQNRTWDTVAEHGESAGVFTDPRPPFGCLGLTMTR
ncbi:MAG TPA: urate oxidase [Bryobacteraceae bacterium]|jgi:urate oxidase|nr:urate oxidase [Bryobacteraceae bacterium]